MTNKFADFARKFLESRILPVISKFHKEYLESQTFKRIFLKIEKGSFQKPDFRRKEEGGRKKREEGNGGGKEESGKRREEEGGKEEDGSRKERGGKEGRRREEGGVKEEEERRRKLGGVGKEEARRRENEGGKEEDGRIELIKLFGNWEEGGREMAEAMEGMAWVETMRRATFV